MGINKTLLLLGLSLAIVLLISSEITAVNTDAATHGGGYNNDGHHGGGGADAATHGGGGCLHGRCRRCITRCCNYAGEVVEAETSHAADAVTHGGGRCFHGRRCRHCVIGCCNYAGEVGEAETTEAKPHN